MKMRVGTATAELALVEPKSLNQPEPGSGSMPSTVASRDAFVEHGHTTTLPSSPGSEALSVRKA